MRAGTRNQTDTQTDTRTSKRLSASPSPTQEPARPNDFRSGPAGARTRDLPIMSRLL